MRQSGFGELENEFVLWLRRVRRVLVPGIIRVTQEIPNLQQLEPRGFDLLPEKRFFDTMQGAGFGDAGTGPARMIGDNIETSRLERAEDGPVHRRAVRPEMSEIVIVEHQRHEIDALRRELGRNGVLEWSGDGDDRR